MLVSIIIPVKNGAATLERCLKQIAAQLVDAEKEIIIIDSGSTDDSLHIAKKFDAKIISIAPQDFNHGATRNLGVAQATGELIYFTVQDAFLEKVDCLQTMLDHFKNEAVMAVNGMQAIEKKRQNNPALWFRRASTPLAKTIYFPKGAFEKLSKSDKLLNTAWDNVNAMYRKTALEELPFRHLSFAEDKLWALDALTQGFSIVVDPSVVAFHYHHLQFIYYYRVEQIVHSIHYMYFDKKPLFPNFYKSVILRVFHLLKNKELSFFNKLYWVFQNKIQYVAAFLAALRCRLIIFFSGKKGILKRYTTLTKDVPQGAIKTANA